MGRQEQGSGLKYCLDLPITEKEYIRVMRTGQVWLRSSGVTPELITICAYSGWSKTAFGLGPGRFGSGRTGSRHVS